MYVCVAVRDRHLQEGESPVLQVPSINPDESPGLVLVHQRQEGGGHLPSLRPLHDCVIGPTPGHLITGEGGIHLLPEGTVYLYMYAIVCECTLRDMHTVCCVR